MNPRYNEANPAQSGSDIYVADVRQFVKAAHQVIANFDAKGVECDSGSDEDFKLFIELLYGSGMVMGDFDPSLFEQGPGRLIINPIVAATMMSRANLLTIRMFLHTLARGYRATWAGYGYPYFAEAYKSGGLRELLNRLEWFCEVAESLNSQTLHAGEEITDDD